MPNEFIINHLPSDKIWINEKEFHFFSGTSYLGLNQNTDFQALVIEGMKHYGMSFGSSRNGNLQLAIYQEAEEKLANWVGAESALTLSSGMLAGQVVANFFNFKSEGKNDALGIENLFFPHFQFLTPNYFYAPQTHSANFHQPNIDLPKTSFFEWTKTIIEQVSQQKENHAIIICNSNDALKCTPYDFFWTSQLPDNQSITLIIDDSHGLGITGENGSGIYKKIKVNKNVKLIVVSSLHKAMGIPGGVVFGEKTFIESLRQTAHFASCSPIVPAYLYAYLKADKIFEENQKKLKNNIQLFTSKLSDKSLYNFTENFPVFYTEHDALFSFLFAYQIFIYSFAYPLKTGKPNTRIVLSAWHKPEQIELLAEKCNEFQNFYTNNCTFDTYSFISQKNKIELS